MTYQGAVVCGPLHGDYRAEQSRRFRVIAPSGSVTAEYTYDPDWQCWYYTAMSKDEWELRAAIHCIDFRKEYTPTDDSNSVLGKIRVFLEAMLTRKLK